METDAMQIFVGGRRSGKTERMIEWLAAGHKTDAYPFWSRVVLTATLDEAERLRKGVLRERFPDEDVYRWVFAAEEWRTAHVGRPQPEVGVDNANWVMERFLGTRVDAATFDGKTWGSEDSAKGTDLGNQ